jgi:hypothetical protein
MEYYVAPDGNDQNAGTKAAPWASLRRAIQGAGPGDTAWFADGTYTNTGRDVFSKAGEPNRPITFRAANPGKAIFQYNAYEGTKWLIDDVAHLRWIGLIFDGGGGSAGGNAVRIRYAHHLLFRSCLIRNTAGHGIRAMTGDIHDLLLESCVITPNVPPEGVRDGICLRGRDGVAKAITVRDCTISHTSHCGLNATNVQGLLVEDCRFIETGTHAIGLRTNVETTVIKGCMIIGVVRGNGIYLEDNGQRYVEISENVIAGCARSAIYFRDHIVGPVVLAHNTLYKNCVGWPQRGEIRAYNVTETAPEIVVHSNLIVCGENAGLMILDGVRDEKFRFDRNLWFGESPASVYRVLLPEGRYTSFTGYQAAGHEPHSIMDQDPLLDSLTFELQPGSPAIGAGLDGTDIGARPYEGDEAPPPPTACKPLPDETVLIAENATEGPVLFLWDGLPGVSQYVLRLDGHEYAGPLYGACAGSRTKRHNVGLVRPDHVHSGTSDKAGAAFTRRDRGNGTRSGRAV